MKPAAFDYVRAEHLDEALDVLGREGSDARIIAGGQSLMPMLNMRLARPRTLIDIMRLDALSRIDRERGFITVGAGVRQAALLDWPELGHCLRLAALALPFAVRSLMPTPAPNCRWCCARSAGKCICAAPNGAGACRPRIFSQA
jgi:CO/xanthine dehydrogenase FAD-binding subunit